MYQKQILMEKLKEATASVLPISLIVMAISFVLEIGRASCRERV